MLSKLAVNGGCPVVPQEFLVPWPQITHRDRELVNDVLDSGILAGVHAPQVKALQEEFAEYLGVDYCIAVNSGTAALHMAVAAAGVGPGDEVITSAFSFLASAEAIETVELPKVGYQVKQLTKMNWKGGGSLMC